MKILVPVKRVIDYNVKVRVKADQSGVELANVDIAKLVENKTSILRNRERIRTEIIKYDDIVTVMNNPSLHDKDKLLPLEQTTIPLYFIVAFLMYSYLKHQYKKVKKLADSKNSEF